MTINKVHEKYIEKVRREKPNTLTLEQLNINSIRHKLDSLADIIGQFLIERFNIAAPLYLIK